MATKALFTAEQYEQLPDTGVRTELVDGEVVVLATGNYLHNVVRDKTVALLDRFQPDHAAAEVEFRTSPARVRRADVAWFREITPDFWQRSMMPVPDLVVEVVSPGESAMAVRAKVHEYLDAGVSTVWLIYPDAGEADIWNRGGQCYMGVKTLTADCLPKLSVPMAAVLPATAVPPPPNSPDGL